jgi:hypothetical protein
LLFSPHGIFVGNLQAWKAIFRSIRVTNATLPTTGLFFLAVILLSQGLDLLWSVPPENSWLMLVGLLGHAFVATSLLSASFIYYRDVAHWLESLSTQLTRSSSTSKT